MGDDRPSVYEEGDKLVFRASALGRCRTSLWYTREGYPANPPSEAVRNAWEAGNRWEDLIILQGMDTHDEDLRLFTEHELDETGFVLSERGEDQTPQVELELHLGNSIVRCHPDGIATDGIHDYVVEAKLVGESLWQEMSQKKLSPYYQMQFDIEILAAREYLPNVKGLYIVARKIDNVPSGEYKTWVQDNPTITAGAIKRRINDIRKASQPPVCDQNMYGCEFWPLCDRKEMPVITDGLAVEAAKVYAEVDAAYKVAAEARKQARKALLDALKDRVEESTRVGEVTVSVSERRGSIDMEALCHDHPSIEPEKYRQKPSKVVSLSVRQPPNKGDDSR